jgi:(4S)-4-hydroxy-5-phosphonooxypentane-2,3-dione isomerase
LPATPVVLIVKWTAEPDHQEEIAEILRTMTELVRQEPGCLSYEVFRSSEDPQEFMLVEVYKDQDAVTAHGQTDYFKSHVLDRALPVLKARQRGLYRPLD